MAGLGALINAGMRVYMKDEISGKLSHLGRRLNLFNVMTLNAFQQSSHAIRRGGASAAMAMTATGVVAAEASRIFTRATYAMVGGIKKTISAAAELESELTMFTVISGQSANAVAGLRKKIIEFTTPLPTSATEVARAATAFARMGFAAKATSDQMIRMAFEAIKFGRAIGVTDEKAAMFIGKLATWLNVAEPTPEKMEEISSVVTRLGWVIKGQATDVIRATERFGAFVRAMGATEAQTLSLAALVQDSGILIRRGSTAINRTFQLMSVNARSFGQAVAKAGVVAQSADFERLFQTDPVEAFNKVLLMLNKSSGQQATILLKQLGLHGNYISDLITMSRNQERWNSVIRKTADEELEKVADGSGASTKAFDAMQNTFNMAQKTFKGAMQNLMIVLGGPLLEPISAVLQGLSLVLQDIMEMDPEILKWAGYILFAAGAVMVLVKAFGVLKVVFGAIRMAQLATLAGFIKLILVLAAVAAIAVGVWALINYLKKKAKGEATTFVGEAKAVSEQVKGAVTSTSEALTGGIALTPEAAETETAGLTPPELPGAQKGGIFLQPTPVVIAEREPEAVIPLRQMNEMMGRMMNAAPVAAGAGGAIQVTTPLYLDGMVVAESVSEQAEVDRIRRGF
jgi:TP901 family phage tail tape measure protein